MEHLLAAANQHHDYDDDDEENDLNSSSYSKEDEFEVEAESVAEVAHEDDDVDSHDDNDEDDDEDEDDEEDAGAVVVEAVVVDEEDGNIDDDEDAESISVAEPVQVEVEPPKKKKKKPGPKPKKVESKKKPSAPPSSSNATKKKSGSNKKKPAAKSKPDTTLSQDSSSISPHRLAAAAEARQLLLASVPTLPANLGDAQVRSMGKLLPSKLLDNPFATPNALYSVGFSCDRYDFSPAHGRILKLRCSVLDGRRILQQRKEMDFLLEMPGEPALLEGPIFRIMWGRGIDEDEMDEYQYDPLIHSEYVLFGSKAAPHKQKSRVAPMNHMRVKTRFDENQYYMGTIVEVNKIADGGGKAKKIDEKFTITIRYDDGTEEHAEFPDPDIQLFLQGTDPDIDPNDGRVELNKLNGKPVVSVIGLTPLEAWGRVLIKLGLIDEIMHEAGVAKVDELRSNRLGANDKSSRLESTSSPDSYANTERMDQLITNGDEESTAHDDGGPRDPPSEKEKFLRNEVAGLMEELREATEDDRMTQKSLADARIFGIGPFLGNPFSVSDPTKSQHMTWLTVAIKRERNRMGTNKRKVITSIDILDKSDSFYNPEINALLEGLPGSEYCASYVFNAHRGKGGQKAAAQSRMLVQEARKRREQEPKKKAINLEHEAARAIEEEQRERKRKEREEERDEKKRQRLEEEDLRKQARINERLARLRVQVEERLLKEVAVQREKVIALMATKLAKEFGRRRRAAETLASQTVLETKRKQALFSTNSLSNQPLPNMSERYSEDVVRVWDFISTFGEFFVSRNYISEVPSLRSLQSALDCLNGKPVVGMRKEDAVDALTDLAIALCKPLTATLTRVLFASLIALNPNLQKDFGAAFFNEMSSADPPKVEDAAKADVLLPVNPLTWLEVARLAFIADALGELGLQRHEVAHILRGYRSAGHPNSKEAQRLRKVEGHTIALLKQEVSEGNHLQDNSFSAAPRVRVDAPCDPICGPKSHWFHLHSFLSTPEAEVGAMRDILARAIDILTSGNNSEFHALNEELLSAQDTLGQVVNLSEPTKPELKIVRKVRRQIANAFDKNGGNELSTKGNFMKEGKWPWQRQPTDNEEARRRMGLLKSLSITRAEYKKLVQRREHYMEDALRIKEEMEREKTKEEGDDDEDEEEEEDDEGGQKAEVMGDIEDDAKANAEANVLPKIGKETPYDDFCGDNPVAPDLLRRCLAVLRTLAVTGSAEPFIYPVDPQTNPGYYDAVLRPMCLREAGRQLLEVAANSQPSDEAVDRAVLQFGRNVRLISQNCLCYSNAGPMVIAAGAEMLKIFERLFFDWVLAPQHLLPPLNELDDEKCVEHHDTDDQSTVLLCDSCEGKYNIHRLIPPLKEIPKGDWYCPRCVSGRCWGTLDPRIGKQIVRQTDGSTGTILRCFFTFAENAGGRPTLHYEIKFSRLSLEYWSLESVDNALALAGTQVAPIRCLEAVAESPGYGDGVDAGLRSAHLIPVPLDPSISDAAAQATLASSVFRDTIAASATMLLIDPYQMTADEWLRLLVLLVMKCSASDVMQNVCTKMENAAAEGMGPKIETLSKVTDIRMILLDELPVDDDYPKDFLEEKRNQDKLGKMKKEIDHGRGEDSRKTPVEVGSAVVVDAGAVEVVEEVDASAVDKQPSTPTPIVEGKSDPVVSSSTAVSDPVRDPFKEIQMEKAKRHKIMEDLFAAQTIKNQIRIAVASFEEDNVSSVVDSALSGRAVGLDFRSLQCRRDVCFLCGLPDQALGSPFMRMPDREQWDELIPYGVGKRRTHLVADDLREHNGDSSAKLVSLCVRLDGELVSEYDADLANSDDGALLELTPRAENAFQNELQFRYNNDLSFVTGSLSAHECCAFAAHNARKEQMLQEHREKQAELIEREAGTSCGRTLQIGRDNNRRAYYKLKADPESLFVCETDGKRIEWLRFPDAVCVSSVIVTLGKDPLAKDLKRIYPAAWGYIKNGSWSNEILRRRFPQISKIVESDGIDDDSMLIDRTNKDVQVEGGYDPYVEGEEVLVEAKSKRFLWDASILEVSRKGKQEPIDAYKVDYMGWSSRFVEWVQPCRVVEPSEHNKKLQGELLDELALTRGGLPSELNFLAAKDFLHAGDRARGASPLPDFAKIALTDETKPMSERILALMKAATLAIEASLPVGSIQNTESGVWRSSFAREWRQLVCFCKGPAALMRLVIFLEDNISPEWIREDVGNLRSCLPNRWKAVLESCASGLAMRIILLDRAVKYGMIDRKRYAKRKRRL